MNTPLKTVVLALAVLLLLAAGAAAQQQPKSSVPFEGTHLFRNLLNVFKLLPAPSMADLATLPAKKTVLIVFGDLACLDQLAKVRPGGLKKFLDDGGAILIANDRPDHGRLWEFDLKIPGQPPPDDKGALSEYSIWQKKGLRVPSREELWRGHWQSELYKEFPDCIKINDHRRSDHPIFARCEKGIATNAPSYILRGPHCPVELLCSFPFVRTRDAKPRFVIEDGYAFAVGSSGKPSSTDRVLFLSGHGVFMNVMLAQGDTDNLDFAVNTLRWLTNDKKRAFCLFLEENQVITDFNVPIGEPPMPTARIFNDLLRGLEEENFFNRLLLANLPKRSIQRWLLALALVGLAMFGLQRVLRARFRQDNT